MKHVAARMLGILALAGWMGGASAAMASADAVARAAQPLEITRADAGPDAAFVELARACIDTLLMLDPEWATQVGEHRYDTRLTDRSRRAIRRRVAFLERARRALHRIDPTRLSPVDRVDWHILDHQLERMRFEDVELREWAWNPLLYNPGGAIYSLIAREFAPLEVRLRAVAARLDRVGDVAAAARANLETPPRVHTETAIRQLRGTIGLVRDGLDDVIGDRADLAAALAPSRRRAVEALEALVAWMEQDLLARSTGDFRLGDALWRRKLHYTLDSDLSKETILQRATADLEATQAAMVETARPLFRRLLPGRRVPRDGAALCRAVLDRLARSHPDNATIVARARRTLAEAVNFAREHDLVTVPDEPVRLIVMPEFQRGVAVAYCDAPGPLDRNLATFYAISPTPADWSSERVESFFREYNDWMIYDLTVHEAVPGHYLQLAHANRFEAPTPVRAIFSSGPFVEGWAVYAERMMAEAGFGGPEVRMQQLKMRLRVIINAIIDQKIHTEGMTREEAMALMMDRGYQEEGEAAGKWVRASLTSTQLSTYFVGSAEVEDIAADLRRAHPDWSTRRVHDRMLAFGSPAPRYLRTLLGLGGGAGGRGSGR